MLQASRGVPVGIAETASQRPAPSGHPRAPARPSARPRRLPSGCRPQRGPGSQLASGWTGPEGPQSWPLSHSRPPPAAAGLGGGSWGWAPPPGGVGAQTLGARTGVRLSPWVGANPRLEGLLEPRQVAAGEPLRLIPRPAREGDPGGGAGERGAGSRAGGRVAGALIWRSQPRGSRGRPGDKRLQLLESGSSSSGSSPQPSPHGPPEAGPLGPLPLHKRRGLGAPLEGRRRVEECACPLPDCPPPGRSPGLS